LLKRVFTVDVLRCGCGGRRRILAAITQAEVIVAILAALHLPTEAPVVHPAGARTAGAVRRRVTRRGRVEAEKRTSAEGVMKASPASGRRDGAEVGGRLTG